jgi:glutathione synthase/RimK-type ligase-like ATP-grasp enzyme
VVVHNHTNLAAGLQKIGGDIVVAKPVDGSCGVGVFVEKRSELASADLKYPLLLQELIDMQQGIPGLCSGPHDLRLVFVGGTFALCTLRTPAQGSLVANLSKGGSVRTLPLSEIPKEALTLAKSLDRQLQAYPERVYSIDMGLHKGTDWKVIEFNAPPGLTPPAAGEETAHYYDVLAAHLVRLAGM